MDRANRLIRWQRITIMVLLMAVISLGVSLYTQTFAVKDAAEEAQRLSVDNQNLTSMFNNNEEFIGDMDTRLKEYEAKYGPIEPRRGEGVFIGRTITRGVLPSR